MVYVVFTNFPECYCRLNTGLLNVCKFALQCLSVTLHVFIGVNSYWAQGLKPPPTFMIMGLAYVTSPPHFCDLILSKLCFNCLHWFYAMLTVRPFIPCSARHFKKGAKFAGSLRWTSIDQNAFSFQGGFAPLTP